jgi:phage shock protein C
MNGIGFFIYIILMIIMPNPEKLDQPANETIRENVQEMGERIKEAGEGMGMAISKNTEEKHSHRAGWFGIILIILGIILLLDKLNLIKWFDKDLLWPVIIIFIGVWLLINAGDEKMERRPGFVGPLLLIMIGFILLFNKMGLIHWESWGSLWHYWPVILILWGIEILARHTESDVVYFMAVFISILVIIATVWLSSSGYPPADKNGEMQNLIMQIWRGRI